MFEDIHWSKEEVYLPWLSRTEPVFREKEAAVAGGGRLGRRLGPRAGAVVAAWGPSKKH